MQDPVVAGRDHPDLDATRLKVQPGIEIGGELFLIDKDVVARLPVKAVRNERKPVGRAFHEGDLVSPGIDQFRTGPPRFDHLLRPFRIMKRAAFGRFFQEQFDGCLDPERQRRNACVVKVEIFFSDGKFLAIGFETLSFMAYPRFPNTVMALSVKYQLLFFRAAAVRLFFTINSFSSRVSFFTAHSRFRASLRSAQVS